MSELLVPSNSNVNPQFGLFTYSSTPVYFMEEDTTVEIVATSKVDIFPVDPMFAAFDFEVFGSNEDDTIALTAGNDEVFGGSGEDEILGNSGEDFLAGQQGNDFLYGNGEADILLGGSGKDYLNGGNGNDILKGGVGDDVLVGGTGTDTLIGGKGDDLFIISGADQIFGEKGQDTFSLRVIDSKLAKINNFKNEDTLEIKKSLLPGSGLTGKLTAKDFETVEKLNSDIQATVVYEQSSGIVYYNPSSGVEVALIQLDPYLNLNASSIVVK